VPHPSAAVANLIIAVPLRHTLVWPRSSYGRNLAGISLAVSRAVNSVFAAGSDLVRWHLVAMDVDGPYRLTLHHARGSIVEYFMTTDAALKREQELERLLIAASGPGFPLRRIAS
jgi:hypothetical protein